MLVLLRNTILWPAIGAFALCAIGSLCPVRFDLRTLQDLQQLEGSNLPQSNLNYVYCTADNGVEHLQMLSFGLKLLAFPGGRGVWVVPKENLGTSVLQPVVAVDAEGRAFRAVGLDSSESGESTKNDVESLSRDGAVIFDTPETRAVLEKRWPFLRRTRTCVILSESQRSQGVGSVVWAGFHNEFMVPRFLRLTALFGSCLAIQQILVSSLRIAGMIRWIAMSSSIFLAIGLNSSFSFVLQWANPQFVPWTSFLIWGISIAVAIAVARSSDTKLPFPSSPHGRCLIVYGLTAYLLLFLVRLDFDGDFFFNWLPQARYHVLLNRHEPTKVLAFGSMQGASYPPGYGIFLATVMRAAGLDDAAFGISRDTSFFILIYRCFVFALNAAFMAGVIVYLASVRNVGWLAALTFGAAMTLLIPSLLGKHIAAETLLFPLLGTAVVSIAAGVDLSNPRLIGVGLAIGSLATLFKWEAVILFLAGALPWLFAGGPPEPLQSNRARYANWLAVVLVGLIPTLVWKLTLDVRNEFFAPMTWDRFREALPGFPRLVFSAVRILLADGRILVLIAAPAAIYPWSKSNPWSAAWAIPVGSLALFAGWIVVFLFSNLNPIVYLETSYERLTMLPTFSLLLFTMRAAGALGHSANPALISEPVH